MLTNLYESHCVKKHCVKKKCPSFANTQMCLNARSIVVGGSSSGKTHALFHYLLKSPNTYAKVIIVNKGIDEPLYQTMRDKLKGNIQFYLLPELPTVNELYKLKDDDKAEWLVVFDDLVNDLDDKKSLQKVSNYYITGRKLGFTMFFLTQSYFKTPKILRLNSTYIILLKLSSNRDLNLIIPDFQLGIEKKELEQIYQVATKKKFDFLKIDTDSTDPNKKFSHNFTSFFKVSEEEGTDDEA